MSENDERIAPGFPDPRPLRVENYVPKETKANLQAIGMGCAAELLLALLGVLIGYLLMPKTEEGGYYGAIADALGSLILYCGSGLVLGVIVGAFLGSKVAKHVAKSESKAGDKDPI